MVMLGKDEDCVKTGFRPCSCKWYCNSNDLRFYTIYVLSYPINMFTYLLSLMCVKNLLTLICFQSTWNVFIYYHTLNIFPFVRNFFLITAEIIRNVTLSL